MMQKLRGWIMPGEDARDFISLIDEKLRSPRLDQRYHDVLVRLRSMLEDDLMQAVDDNQTKDTSEPAQHRRSPLKSFYAVCLHASQGGSAGARCEFSPCRGGIIL
jgi:hypothetical protein